ncbi:acyl-CoA reductase [Roseateles sp.]|uniref:acyl-CoA reductase n=1 Tax=Roseateles sp. TaxID=1971397 RepID=UPI003BA5C368
MNLPSIDVVLPHGQRIEDLAAHGNLPPFGSVQLGFASQLAKALTVSAAVRAFPELVALGFWLRPANLKRTIDAFITRKGDAVHLPRGLVFHVAPSNVDTIFVYSWFISLLCGNRNIIRLSSKETPQTTALLAILEELLTQDEWRDIAQRTLIVRYGHDAAVSAALSAACDVRVIWGGDDTIRTFRDFPLNPRATELAFANKFSMSVLDARTVAEADSDVLQKLTGAFHNDVYWFGQMACSSPRMLLWLGSASQAEAAAGRFWPALRTELDRRGVTISAPDHMNKEVTADALAIEQASVQIETPDPRITRVRLPEPALLDELHCGAGLFHEARIDTLDALKPLLSRKIQTISHFGVTTFQWKEFLGTAVPAGIDRIVPMGSALDFEPIWDGQDLLQSFLRQVTVQ